MKPSVTSRVLLALVVLGFAVQVLGVQAAATDQAKKEYKALLGRIAKIKTLSGVITVRDHEGSVSAKYAIIKPDRYRFDLGDRLLVCDGKILNHSIKGKILRKFGLAAQLSMRCEVGGFDDLSATLEAVRVSDCRFEGRKCRAIEVKAPGRPSQGDTVFVDVKTGLPAGYRSPGPEGRGMTLVFSDLKVNPRLSANLFVVPKPASAPRAVVAPPLAATPGTVQELPAPVDAATPIDASRKLLEIGKTAPTFRLPALGGGKLSLKESLRGKRVKAVVLLFWTYG